MEHSYLGDLEMWLECPDGTTVTLFDAYDGGFIAGGGFSATNTFLGEPIDDDLGNPGNGYEYCFSSVNNAWGDFPTEFGNMNMIGLTSPPAPSAGNTMNPNGVYLPEQSFNDFSGCPLNGDWTLNVRDNIFSDDGFIFEWGLFFDADLFSNNETYQNTITTSFWSPDPSITPPLSGDTMITVHPSGIGDYEYTLNVEDDFGCIYDTTVVLHVKDTVSVVNTLDTTLVCPADNVPLWVNSTGLNPVYTWEDSQTGDTAFYDVTQNGVFEYVVSIVDDCETEYIDTARITLNQTLIIDSLIQTSAECGIENGIVEAFGDGFTGTPEYQWSGPGLPASDSISTLIWENLPSGWYYFTIEDDVCSVNDSIFLEQNPPPIADFDANPIEGVAPLGVGFLNNSEFADVYEWDFGNGEGNTVTALNNQSTTYIEEGVFTVTLTVTGGECFDVATENITVFNPLEYDMPNVFTPNGDGVNDMFTINPVNAERLDMVITNRWGSVVYQSNEINSVWNGENSNGVELKDGTYFYKFTIESKSGESKTEHGFVHLVRDNK